MIYILKEILKILNFLHSNKIYHLSLKSESILVFPDNTIKLEDNSFKIQYQWNFKIWYTSKCLLLMIQYQWFLQKPSSFEYQIVSRKALSKLYEEVGTVKGQKVPYWMSPELIRGGGFSNLTDIWSVGVILLELVEGKPPYSDLQPFRAIFKIVNEDLMLREPEKSSDLLLNFIDCCLCKNPEDRLNAQQLLDLPFLKQLETD